MDVADFVSTTTRLFSKPLNYLTMNTCNTHHLEQMTNITSMSATVTSATTPSFSLPQNSQRLWIKSCGYRKLAVAIKLNVAKIMPRAVNNCWDSGIHMIVSSLWSFVILPPQHISIYSYRLCQQEKLCIFFFLILKSSVRDRATCSIVYRQGALDTAQRGSH